VGPALLIAQTATPPPPPYLGTIPPHTAWTVTAQPKTKPADGPEKFNPWHPKLDSMTGLKDGKNLKIVSAWKGGPSTEMYVVDGIVYKSSSAKYPDDVLILDPASPTLAVPRFNHTDFPEYLWAGPDTYVGTAREGGVSCQVYELNAESRTKALDQQN